MIETDRLILRSFREGDAADVLEYLKEPMVNCFAGKPLGAQIPAFVGILFFECLARVEIVHSDGTPVNVVSKIIAQAKREVKKIWKRFH